MEADLILTQRRSKMEKIKNALIITALIAFVIFMAIEMIGVDLV